MVFVVATANRIDLPPELFRRGRFDEVFYVDFPDRKEAEQIIKLHLKRRSDQQDRAGIETLDLTSALNTMFENGKEKAYAGADLESVAALAVEQRYFAMLDASVGTPSRSLKDAVEHVALSGVIKPIGFTMKEEIKETREKFNKMGLRSASRV